MNLRHPVVLTLVGALVLVLIGIVLVQRQRAVVPSGGSATFSGNAGYLDTTTAAAPQADAPAKLPDVSTNSGPDTLVVPKVATGTASKPKTARKDGAFDFNALLADLKHAAPAQQSPQTNSTYEQLLDAFSFTPTIAAPVTKTRTPEQQALFDYGNVIGARLQGFAAVNPNMAQTLTDQVKHRTDTALGDAVRELGSRYQALGEGILAIHDVPPIAETAHQKLGQSYIDLGTALSAVPAASDDQAFLAAITTYNNKADAFTTAFVGMASLFTTMNVTFDSSDAGSAFSFRHN